VGVELPSHIDVSSEPELSDEEESDPTSRLDRRVVLGI
jgi:hypothetical protein